MVVLVGSTGFVGSNILEKGQIDNAYNSKNIEDSYGTNPELLIYAGLRAEKYLANDNPEADMELIIQAQENIKKINPKRLVLISTVDVLKDPDGMDETSLVDATGLQAYGHNRYKLELWARENYPDALIIRLPALFGINIKKNFIYDFINLIPFMLKQDKFAQLLERDNQLINYYTLNDSGFYKVNELTFKEKKLLKEKFITLGFTAMNFTDSRGVYQFYNLSRLWDDILIALEAELTLWHPATEPISIGELYQYLTGNSFVNELSLNPVHYDFRTVYGKYFGGNNGYICDKEQVMRDIKEFIEKQEKKNAI